MRKPVPKCSLLQFSPEHNLFIQYASWIRSHNSSVADAIIRKVTEGEFSKLLFLFYTLCTEFTMFRFASHIFVLLYLVRYILTSRMQRTHTALGRF